MLPPPAELRLVAPCACFIGGVCQVFSLPVMLPVADGAFLFIGMAFGLHVASFLFVAKKARFRFDPVPWRMTSFAVTLQHLVFGGEVIPHENGAGAIGEVIYDIKDNSQKGGGGYRQA